MLSNACEEGKQCGSLAIANVAANDQHNIFRIGDQPGLFQGLLQIIRSSDCTSSRETAAWALAICICNDELTNIPRIWELGGIHCLCDVLAKRSESERFVQYSITIVQLATEILWEVLSKNQRYLQVEVILGNLESDNANLQEYGLHAVISLASCEIAGIKPFLFLHPRSLAAFSKAMNGKSKRTAAIAAQLLGENLDFIKTQNEDKHFAASLLLETCRKSIPLADKAYALAQSIRKRFISNEKVSTYDSTCTTSIRMKIDRNNVLGSALKQLGQINGKKLLSLGYQFEFTNYGFKETGLDYGGLRREGLRLIASELFEPGNGFVLPCFNTLDSETGMLQINPSKMRMLERKQVYEMMGKVLALAFAENIPLGISMTPSFWKIILLGSISQEHLTIEDLMYVDEQLYRSLAIRIPSLEEQEMREVLSCITFSVPSRSQSDFSSDAIALYSSHGDSNFITPVKERREYKESPLKPGGDELQVTPGGYAEYRNLVVQKRLFDDVKQQMDFLCQAFHDIVPDHLLNCFSHGDLQSLMFGVHEVQIESMMKHVEYGESIAETSQIVQWFWTYVSSLSNQRRLELLQWITGITCLPIGGFSRLGRRIKLVQDVAGPDRLPTVSTCTFTLHLPKYRSFSQLKEKFDLATSDYVFGIV
mmetsp:Transcript_40085/g.126022  ORF Transcript_40085/g.126022 Transcript_40085/m.126022 type:complete len:651 (+) Transcript_40085:754-2706(+)